MIHRFRRLAFRRWMSPILVLVMILGLSPGAALGASAPDAPPGLTAAGGDKQVYLTWDEPAGAPDDYGVQYRLVGGSWAASPTGSPPACSPR